MRGERGFSLVQVLLAAAMLGGLSLLVMRISHNTQSTQINAESNLDLVELSSTVRMALSNPNFCRVSLGGNDSTNNMIGSLSDSDFRFNKQDVDHNGVDALDSNYITTSEGFDVELWLGNSDGSSRARKLLNGDTFTGVDKSRFGRLEIKKVRLVMNRDATISDFSNGSSFTNYPAQLVVLAEKKGKVLRKLVFNLLVSGETNVNGSKITSCGYNDLTSERETYGGPNCPPGRSVVRKYYPAKRCNPPSNRCYFGSSSCTTSSGWFQSPPTCNMRIRFSRQIKVCRESNLNTNPPTLCVASATFSECE